MYSWAPSAGSYGVLVLLQGDASTSGCQKPPEQNNSKALPLSRMLAPQRNFCFSSFSTAKIFTDLPDEEDGLLPELLVKLRTEKGKGCCASPKPSPPTASLLCYLPRNGFVLRKDALSVPGVIYSRKKKNELPAGEAQRSSVMVLRLLLPFLPWGVTLGSLQGLRNVVAKPFRLSSLVIL